MPIFGKTSCNRMHIESISISLSLMRKSRRLPSPRLPWMAEVPETQEQFSGHASPAIAGEGELLR